MASFIRFHAQCAVLLLCLNPHVATAQFQRMGIPQGAFELAANGAGVVQAFCMDFSRATPERADRFSHVLTSTNSARVQVGERTLSLQEAIDRGLISVTGADSYSRINFVNHTNERVVVSFSENAVLSGRPEGTADIKDRITTLRRTSSEAEQLQLQRRLVWGGEYVKARQRTLAELGYYRGGIDGEVGPATRRAVRDYRRDAGFLPFDDVWSDDLPNPVLRRNFTVQNARLRQARDASEHSLLVSVRQSNDGAPTYVLEGGFDVPLRSRSIAELAERTSDVLRGVGSQRGIPVGALYFETAGFTADQRAAFLSTFRSQMRHRNPSLSVRPIGSSSGGRGTHDYVFTRGAEIVHEAPAPVVQVQQGRYRGWFRSHVRFTMGGESKVMTVFARTREVLQAFLDQVKNLLVRNSALPPERRMNLADIVSRAMGHVKSVYPVSDADIGLVVGREIGNSQTVEAPHGRRSGVQLAEDRRATEPLQRPVVRLAAGAMSVTRSP